MKTISDQLKDLGLSHGDLCEIEGVEGRCLVAYETNDNETLYAKAANGIAYSYTANHKVTCGWRANSSHITAMLGDLAIYYTKVLPKTSPKPLPESVEASIEQAIGMDVDSGWRRVISALLAEVDKRIEAAKPKGTLEDIVGVNPVYGPKRN